MTALVIKNLPSDVLIRLKERAKANHRSLTKEAIVLLSSGVGQAVVPRETEPLQTPHVQPGGPLSIDEIEPAVHAGTDVPRPTPDGREALRAALLRQADGSYINVLGIEDESFFKALDSVRSEFRFPEVPDFGDESR